MHLGLICPELTGHLNPMSTLGRELKRRGHRVTVLGRPDSKRKALASGLEYLPIGEADFPVGTVLEELAQLGGMQGTKALRFTVEVLRRGTAVILRDAPAQIREAGIEALLVDQVTPAGARVAEWLGLSYVTVCNALAVNPDPGIPPAVLPWAYAPGMLGRWRNAIGNRLLNWNAKPIFHEIYRHHVTYGPSALATVVSYRSPPVQIAQQPAFFDFPRVILPSTFHYTGPWLDDTSGEPTPFPWQRLDGRPFIYASMGTLRNRLKHIFDVIAAAVAELDVQLVISLGSRDRDAATYAARFGGKPIVVPFAPQLELLDKATLTITHAGLNSTLESMTRGVPMVAIPITNDQPGVASRIAWLGLGEVVQPGQLTVPRLKVALAKVLYGPTYRAEARRRQAEIASLDGLRLAADIAEHALRKVGSR